MGVRLGKQWFCSPDCFEEYLSGTITASIMSRQVDPPPVRRMPLGLLLLSRGVLTSEQLASA
ncbi:MAG: hypothetical protein WCA92_21450, partial [Terriglobales bacterium]